MQRSAQIPANRLPVRYQQDWGTEFWALVRGVLFPGAMVLDVGPGRTPTIPPLQRPADAHYVALDISAPELAAAGAGAYDETVVGDAEIPVSALIGRFDLIVSWNALEHVRHLDRAAALFHDYAKPGAWFVACLPGRNAVFALANRALPQWLATPTVARLRQRPRDSVFAAHYDFCTDGGLRRAFANWEELQIVPLWHAADYFDRCPRMQSLYLRYENWLAGHGVARLATNYVVAARKGKS